MNAEPDQYRRRFSMKKHVALRRLNRGLALGLALILAVVLYTVIADSLFRRNDAPALEAFARRYLAEYAEFYENFDAQKCGHTLTDEEIDARIEEFSAWMASYFVYWDGNINGVSFVRKEEAEKAYREYLKEGMETGEVESLSFSVMDTADALTVKKTGSNRATITVSFDVLKRTRGSGSDGIYLPGVMSEYSYEIGFNGDIETSDPGSGESAATDKSLLYEQRGEGDMIFYLNKISGEWKVVGVRSYLYFYETRLVEGGEVSE